MTQHLYLSQIRTALPEMVFEQVEQTGGQFNDVVIVNGAFVFRFPRYRAGVTRLKAETQLLQALHGRLPVPVPRPEYQNFDPPVPGLAFVGYRRLPGRPLLRELMGEFSADYTHKIAAQLADFLRALHNLPLAGLPADLPGRAAGDGPADRRPEWEAMYAKVRETLFPAMRPDAQRKVMTHFESFLDDPFLHDFTPCPRHGDFGGGNILWDPATGQVTGVIDFSFCAPGDPAIDLASIFTLGEPFFSQLVDQYVTDAVQRHLLLARARFYHGTYALQEALDGLRDGDEVAYQHGMEDYI